MLTVAVICAVLSISTGYFYSQRQSDGVQPEVGGRELLQLVLGVQALVLAAGGSIACLNSIFKEKERNSFDFQRVTSLTPFELAVGKLFGAPVLMYFVCICLMPLSIFAALAAKSRISFFLAAYAALFVASLAFHSLSLLMSVLSIRGSQTGAIILILMLLWIGAFGGGATSRSVFRLGSLGPFFAAELVTQKTWQVAELEKVINLNGWSYNPNYGMTDSLFARHLHHFPVFVGLDTFLGLWFFLAIVRNIKRDPQEYEIYSPSQSLVFALFLNLIFLAFFNWQLDTDSDAVSFLLSLNMAVFILLGLALLRNRERTRRILRSKADSLWLVNAWPAPILYLGTLTAGAMVAAGALLSHAPKQLDLRFQLLRVLFFAFWLVRDLQFLQWTSLRKGRSPLVMGVLYLVIFYVCSSTLLAAFGCFRPDRAAFTAFSSPTPLYWVKPQEWAARPAIWIAALLAQLAITAFFIYMQKQKLQELAATSESSTAH